MMMENILLITGNVQYTITLDPGVWIFDDRRIDLTTYFQTTEEKQNELEEYTKTISKHWDREIMEGATYPPTLKAEKKYEKEKMLTGTFGIPFKPFLTNAEPNSEAKMFLIKTLNGDIEIPLNKAFDLIFGFSEKGKRFISDGPIHIYFGDGSNEHDPIKNVQALIVK
jgi:hypothetical protein